MTGTNTTFEYMADLIGGFADAGCTVAFISPGSRNTPLTMALAYEPRIDDVSIRDERSAAFAALGHAKATGTPAIILCTSGSAAAHYLPGIVEANQSATPLIVLTADRPVRLRGTGAPQTMDQTRLYGHHVKTFVELDPATAAVSGLTDAMALYGTAVTSPAGPVHANIPLDEPLLPTDPVAPSPPSGSVPVIDRPEAPTGLFTELEGRTTLIVVGGRDEPGLADLVTHAAVRLAAPVFADPQANIAGPNTLAFGDLIVGVGDDSPTALIRHRPDVVLRIGPIPTSKPMWRWLESSRTDQILIEASRLTDPLSSAGTVVNMDPVATLMANPMPHNADRTFLDTWLGLDATAGEALDGALSELPFPNEPGIARIVSDSVPPDTILFVASSRPIRDIDAFAPPRHDVRVIANRGLNGIDGTISTAMGIALAGTPTTVLIGDLAALHDVSALSEVARLRAPLRLVVVNNDGGGIFSFLPQATSSAVGPEVFERHWATPHGLRLAQIAEVMGVPSATPETPDALEAAVVAPITQPDLIEIRTDRHENFRHHETIRRTVAAALRLRGGEKIEQRP